MKRTSVVIFVLMVFAGLADAIAQETTPSLPYHNELSGFKFYAKYLYPLRPYASDKAEVSEVLGSDQGKTVDGWRLWPLFVGEGGPMKGRLAEVQVIPKKRISMLGVKFPSEFSHSIGGVSEINSICDVYTDNEGLQYWIYAEDSSLAKKGDLMHIVYGATAQTKSSEFSATPKRLQISPKVAEGILCGSAEESSGKRDIHSDQRNGFCGPAPRFLYPQEAKKQGIQGAVHLHAVIGKDGLVKDLTVIDGHPMLAAAALEAVKDWKYRPYLVNGSAVEVETTITVNFTIMKN